MVQTHFMLRRLYLKMEVGMNNKEPIRSCQVTADICAALRTVSYRAEVGAGQLLRNFTEE